MLLVGQNFEVVVNSFEIRCIVNKSYKSEQI